MRIEWALVCRRVEQAEDGTNLFGLGVDTSLSQEYPVEAALTVAAYLSFDWEEVRAGGKTPLRVVVHGDDPTAEPVLVREWEIPIDMDKPDAFYPGWQGHMVQDIPVVFDVAHAGTYTIEVATNLGDPQTIAYVIREP